MRFVSTRSGAGPADFETAVLNGLAPGGGLYLPDPVPTVDAGWRQQNSFADVSRVVLQSWLGPSVGREKVEQVVHEALDFPVPVVPLSGGDWKAVSVVELFHGPTLSFKDFGARCMAGFMDNALGGSGRRTILVATSGDTGSAVADGFAGSASVDVVLLYPRGQVSRTQERQLIVRRPGVRTFAVDGTFDDCQRMVKEIFQRQSADEPRFSSANSINVGRLLPQMVYYFWAALQIGEGEFRCCVPSGNLGNLTAGVLAHMSGFGARRFLAAHNANSFFPDYLVSGEREYKPSVRTLSNAMDVGVPSNFERLVALLSPERMKQLLWSTSVDDTATLESMKRVYEETGYVADPHTAVGLETVRRYRRETGDTYPITLMATAHPAKFPETVERALGFAPEVPERLARYSRMDTAVRIIPPDSEALLAHIDR